MDNNDKNYCAPCDATTTILAYEPEIQVFRSNRGDAITKTYRVFRGIELVYWSVHMDRFFWESRRDGNFMEIYHCKEGRMERKQKTGNVYIMPGDLSVMIRERRSDKYSFPLCHYHGISINIDMNVAPNCLSCFLDDVNVRPKELAKRLCEKENCFIIRSRDYIKHIFAELYSAPENCKKGYFKVKILELFLVLSSVDPSENQAPALSLSKMQTDLAKEAAAWIKENLNCRITVAELSDRFHVSQTHLQNAFKGVYGVPVSSYIRILKMQFAALRLIHTDTAVLEIAAEFGYNNAGKFASAFHRIMGETPGEYRKMHGALT